jgi:hypothetical protein
MQNEPQQAVITRKGTIRIGVEPGEGATADPGRHETGRRRGRQRHGDADPIRTTGRWEITRPQATFGTQMIPNRR